MEYLAYFGGFVLGFLAAAIPAILGLIVGFKLGKLHRDEESTPSTV